MLKRYVLAAAVAGFGTSYSMEKEPAKSEYLEDARQLSQERELYFSILPKDVLGIVQHYRVAELLGREVEKALRAQAYSEALASIQKLAQLPEYTQLFNDPRFIDGLIQKISNRFEKVPKQVAQDINTQGTQLWLTHIRPDQLKLLNAADEGDLVKVQQLIAAGVNVNTRTDWGRTALMCAARDGGIEIAQTLIAAGADINAQNDIGSTALMYAAIRHAATVKMLIGAKANVNAQAKDGKTALMYAAEWADAGIVKELLAVPGPSTMLGINSALERRRGAGADVNAQDKHGKTALSLAQKRSNKEIIELLEKATKK